MKKKTVCVIGLGYIGLPTAALLARKGYSVSGVDVDEEIVKNINKGQIHIIEEDLDELVKSVIISGNLVAFKSVKLSDVYIICVPTPFHEDMEIPLPNIDYVLSAAKKIAPLIKDGDLIILESTSPVGTTKKVQETIIEYSSDIKEFNIAYCPERVLPGKIMKELITNARIIGGLTPISTKKAADFYRQFVEGDIIETDAKTAEMCKLTENSFRDLNIAFANELSMICDKQEINVWGLIKMANKHPRVNILQPGTGVGGHCIAVDPWFIITQDRENSTLIQAARQVNIKKTRWVLDKIKNNINNYFEKKKVKPKIACLGLTFKPDVQDVRESPALKVAETLLNEGYDVKCVDPHVKISTQLSILNFSEALDWADIFCILVKHREFATFEVKYKLKDKIILDFCGLFE